MLTPVEFGGAERVCLTLLKNIDREQFDVFPIMFTRPYEDDNLFVRHLREIGYDFCEIPVALQDKGDYLRVARCYKLVWAQLRIGDFDLLHTHGYLADIIGIPIARLKGIPTLSTCHGYIPTTWKVTLYNALDRIVLKLGTRVLAVSEAIKQHLVDSGLNPGRVRVVVNAVGSATDPDITRANREEERKSHGIRSTDFVLGYVGRLSAEKGLTYLLTACAELTASGVPLRVLIIGEGPQRDELERFSRQLGLGDQVVFAGFQENVARWLVCIDVFVLPSLTEGTPMALLEAMAYGVPAVASAVGGVPQVIKHGETGLLVSPGKAEEIGSAINALFRDPAERQKLAQNSVILARTRYSVERWIGQIEMEYRNLTRRSV
jgi:glycosyltransferase involved in cell wall biosynthesis